MSIAKGIFFFLTTAAMFAKCAVMANADTTGACLSAPMYVGSLPAPRIVMAGDVDGDGRADIISFYPPDGGILDVIRMSPLGKPYWPFQARRDIGKGGIAAACGPFAEAGKASVLVVLGDGKVVVVHGWSAGRFGAQDTAATIPPELLPKKALCCLAGDFDGDGRTDALLIGADGRYVLLHAEPPAGATPRFGPTAVGGAFRGVARAACGVFAGTAEIVWQNGDGEVCRTRIETYGGGARLRNVGPSFKAERQGFSVGRFLAGTSADIEVSGKLLPSGDVHTPVDLPGAPDEQTAKCDGATVSADFNGDGRDDILRLRCSPDRFTGKDALIQFSAPATGQAGCFGDADNDGLLDAWETGACKPGGLDLAELGCSPGHKDIIVEVQRFEDVPESRVRSEMQRAVDYFAGLPVENPDGRIGIKLHVIFREPIPMTERSSPWWDLGARHHPNSHRGITHWMVVYNGGGGQSGEMTDRGGCGSNALYATFIHEFGHQLGLGHTGFWSAGSCPTYPSLMNYTYSYQLNGKGSQIGYSSGRLASVVPDERKLDETIPLPMDQVKFLSGPPYHFRLKPSADGQSTLIDWNWNGVFGEKSVAADINYGYGTTAGNRHTIGKSYTAPAAAAGKVAGKERLLLFCGSLPNGTAAPRATRAAALPSLSPDQPGKLYLRVWTGKSAISEGGKWSDEQIIESAGVTGDPSACWIDDGAWVAYPTVDGAFVRRVIPSQTGPPSIGAANPIPDSRGAQVTLAKLGRQMALLLWRDAKTPVSLRLLTISGSSVSVGDEKPLEFTSDAPVGAAEGAPEQGCESLWVGLSEDAAKSSRWQVRRLLIGRNGEAKQVEQDWVGGEKGQDRGSGRVMLLREPDRNFGPQGRLYLFGCGLQSAAAPMSCQYVTMRIADRSINGGWLTRRYYDEWTQSRSAPGVCFFQGDIFFSARWFGNVRGTENDNLFVGFFGRGIEHRPMGDFDDIGFIRDVGMSHSIPYIVE